MNDLRAQFPWFSANVGRIYADSAATTLKPVPVLQAVERALTDLCANPGRGTYQTATRTAAAVERVREQVAEFVGAQSPDEVAFTSGATAALNGFAQSWGEANLSDGDAVIVGSADHQANVAPWRALQRRLAARKIHISLVDYALNASGDASVESVASRMHERVKLIALTHIHNVFGDQTLVAEVRRAVGPDVRIVLDGAQSVGHIPVDVNGLGIDALAFSGHKMFASMGTGVLWAASRIHEELPAVAHGGHSTSRGAMAERFEAGTPNVPGILSLGAALDFVCDLGLDLIERHLAELTVPLIAGLQGIESLEFLPGVGHSSCGVGYGIASFRLRSQTAADVGFVLDQRGISVRTGSHCSGDPDIAGDSVRVSLHTYNTADEVSQIVEAIAECASS